jgi:hypothetical protein
MLVLWAVTPCGLTLTMEALCSSKMLVSTYKSGQNNCPGENSGIFTAIITSVSCKNITHKFANINIIVSIRVISADIV